MLDISSSSEEGLDLAEKALALFLLLLLGGTLLYVFFTNVVTPLRRPPNP